MNTFSINIFDDSDKPSNSSQSSQPDPLLAFRPESTSLNAPDLLPLHNNPDERFRQNRLINGKTKYEEDKQNIIHFNLFETNLSININHTKRFFFLLIVSMI